MVDLRRKVQDGHDQTSSQEDTTGHGWGTAVLRRQCCVPSSAGQMAGAVTEGAGGEDE